VPTESSCKLNEFRDFDEFLDCYRIFLYPRFLSVSVLPHFGLVFRSQAFISSMTCLSVLLIFLHCVTCSVFIILVLFKNIFSFFGLCPSLNCHLYPSFSVHVRGVSHRITYRLLSMDINRLGSCYRNLEGCQLILLTHLIDH